MKKIITPGKPVHEVKCPHCECEFTCTERDAVLDTQEEYRNKNLRLSAIVFCPYCEKSVRWDVSKGRFTIPSERKTY